MVSLIIKRFVKNSENIEDPAVRRAYGTVSGIVGIFLNIVLFIIKYAAGAISGSIAIISDAFNNLSDAGSSVITLIGFKLSGAKPDEEHPFGHGRMEYISGFVVSLIILLMGIELGKSSIQKIIHPEPVATDVLSFVILAAAILIKLYMFLYNSKIAKTIDSSAIKATAIDSISDSIATSVVLIATLVMKFGGINIDGWCGILVALFILRGGIEAAKDTLGFLLGHGPSPEFVKKTEDIVLSHEEIIGIHDLVVHDYGPGRCMISLHAEVPGNGNMIALHDVVDSIEYELRRELGCEAVIHMDPIDSDDEKTMEMTRLVKEIAVKIDERLKVHDLRIVTGPTHTNVIFDVVVPYRFEMSDKNLKDEFGRMISERCPECFAVINIDQSFV